MGPPSLVILVLLTGTVQGDVLPSFDECNWFFQGKIPPQGFDTQNRVRICQRYKNYYHYATLYSTDLRIPVYSAYRYPCSLGHKKAYRPNPWFYEPQIDDPSKSGEMKPCRVPSSDFQAVESDYQGSGYNRGHLYPFILNRDESATSTCTLTNAVPESSGANNRWYKEAESVAQKLAEICHKSSRSMYLVTGTANPTQKKMKNRVAVPGRVWTALCCTLPQDQNNDACLNNDMGSEGVDIATYNKDFSFAVMKQMEPEAKAEHLMVREVQNRLGVGKIFDSCRGTSKEDEGETFKEVEELISKLVISTDDQETVEDNSPPIPTEDSPAADSDELAMEQSDAPLKPGSQEVDEGVCQSTIASALAPIGKMITLVASGVSAFARLIATVLNIIQVLAVTVLRVPARIIRDSACCLTIMVKYLIVTVATVPQELLSIVVSIISDTAGAISWSARLIKYLVRIL
ncbi:endonuclease domain-containing 1 protein-like [Heterodontus francisci]|uniref:endonuclease domain-containing 1 protein-like n=1 Tax=Heterodontus francisci TaxID=7792 RepID=UPI00355C6075